MHLHFPFTCNGANLSYRKEVFEAVEGFKGIDHIASGDDELLMKKIACKYPQGFRFQSKSWVKTWPQRTLPELMQQKIRWASKWKLGTLRDKAIGFYIMLMYVFILVSVIFDSSSKVFWFSLIAKFIMESWVTSFYWRSKREHGYPFFYNLILFLIYPFYTMAIGTLSIFKKYKWKGREFS
jgi:cellulose synthase/poly-beta-1,6-N-acetylglucosamine synthase-like glycosyltransferase